MLRILLAGVAALLLTEAAAAQPNVEAGRALVQRNCAQCHATGRTDASGLPTAPAFRDLSRDFPMEDLARALQQGILTSHPAMPEFRFKPEEVQAIIDYLKAIQSRQSASWSGRLP